MGVYYYRADGTGGDRPTVATIAMGVVSSMKRLPS